MVWELFCSLWDISCPFPDCNYPKCFKAASTKSIVTSQRGLWHANTTTPTPGQSVPHSGLQPELTQSTAEPDGLHVGKEPMWGSSKKRAGLVSMFQTAEDAPRGPFAGLDLSDSLCSSFCPLGHPKLEVVLEPALCAPWNPWPWPVLLLAHPTFSRLRSRPLAEEI